MVSAQARTSRARCTTAALVPAYCLYGRASQLSFNPALWGFLSRRIKDHMVHLAPGGAMPMQIVKTVYRALADCAFVTPPSERQWETLYGKEVKRRWRDIYTAANTTGMPARHQEIAYRLAVQRLYASSTTRRRRRCCSTAAPTWRRRRRMGGRL